MLPKPANFTAYRRRTFAFFLIGSVLSALVIGLQRYRPATIYHTMVSYLAVASTGRPAEVQGFMQGNSDRIQLLWVVALGELRFGPAGYGRVACSWCSSTPCSTWRLPSAWKAASSP